MKNIDWKLDSAEDISKKVIKLSVDLLRQQERHYRSTNNLIMIEKVARVKSLVEILKLEAKVLMLKKRIE